MLLVIGAAFARALVPTEVVGNGLGNGLESGTAKSEVPSDGSQVEETPKTNNAKHRRNPFAKMFPEFEQLTPDEEYTGERKQDFFFRFNESGFHPAGSALFLSPLIAAGKIKEAQQQSHAEGRNAHLHTFFACHAVWLTDFTGIVFSLHFKRYAYAKVFLVCMRHASIKLRIVPQFRLPSNRTVQSYSGFLTVSKKACNSNLFFWFFPAQQSPATAPVVLWLQVPH